MPLSEHEQRQFEAIERALLADDPKFASAVRRRDPVVAGRRRLVLAIAVLAVGLGALLTGVVIGLWYVGVAGFVVMFGAAVLGVYAVLAMTGRGSRAQTGPGSVTSITERRRRRRAGGGGSGGIVGRLEERWQRRIERQGF